MFLQSPETAAQYAMLADPRRAALFGLVATGGTAVLPRFAVSFDEAAIAGRTGVLAVAL